MLEFEWGNLNFLVKQEARPLIRGWNRFYEV